MDDVLCPSEPGNALQIADWLALGRSATANLVPPEPKGTPDHDRAFLVAFLEELDVNPDNVTAQTGVTDFATILANRFNPAKVIIDSMMSLEFLLLGAKLMGNHTLYKMAVSHADMTMKNQIRDDVFKYTDDEKYLKTARLLANYFISSIPVDGIIPWDFDAPFDPAPRPADSSAATIAAAGLLLLAQYEVDKKKGDEYTDWAVQILNDITSLAWRAPWESLLSNATVSIPAGNTYTGVMYGTSGLSLWVLYVRKGLMKCGR
ncbi:hypothetical protein C0991_000908 [Blastosporella zonata]|nr:hypothetical protein C0991_000908 [Blastosporella zonata]